MRKISAFLLVLLVFVSWRCGYTTRSALISNYRTIYVEPVKNTIDFAAENRRTFYYPLMETKIRDALIARFLFDGNLRIAEADNADLILKGDLIDYSRGALRYTDDDDVQEYRIQVTADIVLKERETEEVLWQKRVTGESTHFVTGALASSENTAVDAAVKDLARRTVEQTIEFW